MCCHVGTNHFRAEAREQEVCQNGGGLRHSGGTRAIKERFQVFLS